MWEDPFLYDLENADDPEFDVAFWAGLLRRLRPRRVLELACGTGRLTVPLARAGVEVASSRAREVTPFQPGGVAPGAFQPGAFRQGACEPAPEAGGDVPADRRPGGDDGSPFELVALDSNATFLERARSRVDAEPGAVRAAVTLVEGDMRAPAVRRPFDLVAVPFNSLAYLLSAEDRSATLSAASALLAPGGHFALDLLAPRYDLLAEATVVPPTTRMDADHGAPSLGVKRLLRTSTDTYDPSTQTLHSVNRYEIHHADGRVEHRVTDLDWHIWFPAELEAALAAADLVPSERYGAYDGTPWGLRARQMLWICARR